jgi:hypothetical protein
MPLTKKQAYKKHLEHRGLQKQKYVDKQSDLVKSICQDIDKVLVERFVPETFPSSFLISGLPSDSMERSLLNKKIQDLYPDFILDFDYNDRSNYLVIGICMKEVSFPNVKPWYSFIKPIDFAFWTWNLIQVFSWINLYNYENLTTIGIVWNVFCVLLSSYLIQIYRK